MMKRSLFLALATGLVAILASGTKSQAASTLVTTTASLYGGYTVDSFVVNYSFANISPDFDSLTLIYTYPAGTLGTPSISGSTGTVTETYTTPTPASDTISDFTFTVPVDISAASNDVSISSAYFVVENGMGATYTIGVSIQPTFSGVPEPGTMALLGTGMTGLLVFRRFFKKRKSAV